MKLKLIILIANLIITPIIHAKVSKCVAHRGNNKFFLENSMESFISAVELKSDGVEFDVRHTKDNVPIIMHDSTMKRVAKHREGKVCLLNKKIHKLNFNTIKENCILKNGEEIPLLQETLIYFKDKPQTLFIELKDMPKRQTLNLIETIIPDIDRRYIISFKIKILKHVINAIDQESFRHRKSYLFKIYRSFIFRDRGFNPDIYFSKLFFNLILRRRHENNLVGIWTVDDSAYIEKALLNNVDFVTTNDPDLCIFLRDRIRISQVPKIKHSFYQ